MYQLYNPRAGFRCTGKQAATRGTWYWNRYPGARVDIESMAYSFSFSDELQQDGSGREILPQPELLKYAQHIADRFDLKSDIAFDTRVASAHFDEDANEARNNRVWSSRMLSTLRWQRACSPHQKHPTLQVESNYKGETYRTGLWPKEGVDFTGKRVGKSRMGSSAVQAPLIAEEADDLVVYQRTATFTTPALNHALDKGDAQAIKANYADYRAKQRLNVLGVVDERSMDRTMDATAEERDRFTAGWSGISGMLFQFADLQVEQEANDQISEYIRDRIRDTVKDEQTAQDLLPTDYPYGTKRPCIDTNY